MASEFPHVSGIVGENPQMLKAMEKFEQLLVIIDEN